MTRSDSPSPPLAAIAAPARPMILGAVGVLSIIVGLIGMIFGLIGVVTGNLMDRQAFVASRAAMAQTSAPANSGQSDSGVDAMDAATRRIVLAGLSQREPIRPACAQQLEALLANAGNEVFPLDRSALTVAQVKSYVLAAAAHQSNSETIQVYILGSGRLELSEHWARFIPDGGGTTVRVRDGQYDSGMGQWLCQLDIDAVVAKARSMPHVTDAMASALRSQLTAPAQTLINATANPADAAAQLLSIKSEGELETVTTRSGAQEFYITSPYAFGMTGGNGPSANTAPPPRAAAMLWLLFSLLMLALSVYLLVIGIFSFRGLPSSRWLHLGYAVAQIPLIVLGAAAAEMLWEGSLGKGGSILSIICFAGSLALAYPLLLIVVMNLPSARAFYKAPVIPRMY